MLKRSNVQLSNVQLSTLWGAAFPAHSRLPIPAPVGADPLPASAALREVSFGLFDCSLARADVSFASSRALHLGAITGASQYPADNIARGAQQSSSGAAVRWLKAGHIAVAAFVAIEFELISAIGGEILMTGGEIDKAHNTRILLVRESRLLR